MIMLCLVLDERSDLGPLFYLAEEVFLLELYSQPLMAKLLPRTTNLYAPVNIYLSSDDLMSSDTAHGPISISGPFIPTLRLPKKKRKKVLEWRSDRDYLPISTDEISFLLLKEITTTLTNEIIFLPLHKLQPPQRLECSIWLSSPRFSFYVKSNSSSLSKILIFKGWSISGFYLLWIE